MEGEPDRPLARRRRRPRRLGERLPRERLRVESVDRTVVARGRGAAEDVEPRVHQRHAVALPGGGHGAARLRHRPPLPPAVGRAAQPPQVVEEAGVELPPWIHSSSPTAAAACSCRGAGSLPISLGRSHRSFVSSSCTSSFVAAPSALPPKTASAPPTTDADAPPLAPTAAPWWRARSTSRCPAAARASRRCTPAWTRWRARSRRSTQRAPPTGSYAAAPPTATPAARPRRRGAGARSRSRATATRRRAGAKRAAVRRAAGSNCSDSRRVRPTIFTLFGSAASRASCTEIFAAGKIGRGGSDFAWFARSCGLLSV